MMRNGSMWMAGLLLVATASVVQSAEPAATGQPRKISYHKDIRPIFVQHCQGCHQPARPMGGYVMTSYADLLKKGDRDLPGIVPGAPEKSMLIDQITPKNGKAEMPKKADALPKFQIDLITEWVKQGAIDDTPPAARETLVDAEHPPVYVLPPVVPSLAYSPDGKLLAVAGYHEILLHKADGTGIEARLVGLAERIQSLAFSPDGKWLAAVGGSPGRFGEVQMWNVEKRELRYARSVTFDTLYGVSWSPDGKLIAFGCGDNTIRAFNAETGEQVLFQGAHNDWVLGTVFSQDGTHVVSISRDRSMKLTEVATQRFIDNITSITPGALKGGLGMVARRPMKERKHAKVPPDTPGVPPKVYDELLVGGSDGVPRLYKMHREVKRVIGDDANKIREYGQMLGRIYAGAFSPDGTRFAVGSSLDGKGEIRIFQTDDGKPIAKFEGDPGPIYSIDYRPDGKEIAVAGFDGKIRRIDAETGKLIQEFLAVPLTAQTAAK